MIVQDPWKHVLMIQRKGAHQAGTWSVPGGWIDYGETAEDAALRELDEEVGCQGESPELVQVVTNRFDPPHDTCVTVFYKVRYSETTAHPSIMEPDKVEAVAWVSPDDLIHLELFLPFSTLLNDHAWVLT